MSDLVHAVASDEQVEDLLGLLSWVLVTLGHGDQCSDPGRRMGGHRVGCEIVGNKISMFASWRTSEAMKPARLSSVTMASALPITAV